MNKHTKKIMKQMITLFEDYHKGRIGLRGLVDGLEGCFNAIDEKLPKIFYDQWFQNWGGLEETLAINKEHKYKKEILEDITALEIMLIEFMAKT